VPVNTNTWQSWPLAARETPFNADDAIARIQNWAGGSAKKFNQAFLFRIDGADPKNPASYRLPLADVSDGRLVLVPRAVFSAGVIMSGGHGGLYDVLDDTERDDIRSVLTRIYDKLSEEYSDPRVVAPWLRGNTKEERNDLRKDMGVEQVNASVRSWRTRHCWHPAARTFRCPPRSCPRWPPWYRPWLIGSRGSRPGSTRSPRRRRLRTRSSARPMMTRRMRR